VISNDLQGFLAIRTLSSTSLLFKLITMETDDEEKISAALKHLTSNTEHWLVIKKVLEDDIRANQEIIILIDKKVKENETKISKLN
jgi:hypothetical protein